MEKNMQIVVQNMEPALQVIEARRPPCPSNYSSSSQLVCVSCDHQKKKKKKVNKLWGLVVSEFHRRGNSLVDLIIALIAYCVSGGIFATSVYFLLPKDQERGHGHDWLIPIAIVLGVLCAWFSFLVSKRLRIWWFDIDDSQKGMSEGDMVAAGSIVHRDIELCDSKSCSVLAVIPE